MIVLLICHVKRSVSYEMSLDVNISEPDEFNCVELHSCIEKVARDRNIDEFKYHVEFVCGKGENFIANVFRVAITDTENSDRYLSVIVKTLVNTTRQELFHELHKREVKAYVNVVSKYHALQNKLSTTDRVVLPTCILSDTSKGKEVIILDDLLSTGYECGIGFSKNKSLDHSQVCLILIELAKFHALSIAFERDDPQIFSKLTNEFQDLLFQETFLNRSKLRHYFTDSFEESIKLITNIEIRSKLQMIKSKLVALLRRFTSPQTFNVFCHGDCWINNLSFRKQESRTDVCFLDFQTLRYCNPATDIIYFLYLSTDSQFRSQYMDDLLLVYYNSFESFLKLFDIDSSSVYPQELFEADVKEMLPFGLLIALVELRIILSSVKNEAELSESTLELNKNVCDTPDEDVIKVRLNDVVRESVDNGTLDEIHSLIEDI